MVRGVDFSYFSNLSHSQANKLASKKLVSLAGNIDFTVVESECLFQPDLSEIDNHAYMHVFGKNFHVCFKTSQKFTVSMFLPDYSEKINIPIVTGTTAVKIKNYSTVILIFGLGLLF